MPGPLVTANETIAKEHGDRKKERKCVSLNGTCIVIPWYGHCQLPIPNVFGCSSSPFVIFYRSKPLYSKVTNALNAASSLSHPFSDTTEIMLVL